MESEKKIEPMLGEETQACINKNKRRCTEVLEISSSDEDKRLLSNKRMMKYIEGSNKAEDIMDRMLSRLLGLDELRGKSSNLIQGRVGGNMKKLIISLIEDIHMLGALNMEGLLNWETKSDNKKTIQMGRMEQEKLVNSLSEENVLRKELEKLKISKTKGTLSEKN